MKKYKVTSSAYFRKDEDARESVVVEASGYDIVDNTLHFYLDNRRIASFSDWSFVIEEK